MLNIRNAAIRSNIFLMCIFAAFLFAISSSTHAWEWNWGLGKGVSGSGTINSKIRNVTGFAGLKLSLPASVHIRQSNTESVVIETDDNIFAAGRNDCRR